MTSWDVTWDDATMQSVHSVQIPATVNQYLRDYQQQGVQFLYSRYSNNAGGVLCDDMGLGKTVQVCAWDVNFTELTSCPRSLVFSR